MFMDVQYAAFCWQEAETASQGQQATTKSQLQQKAVSSFQQIILGVKSLTCLVQY